MNLLAGTLIALIAVALVLEPIIRPVSRAAIARPDSDDDDIDPMQRRRDLALAALKEIEFDQATGKLSDVDYARLYQKYAAQAVQVMHESDDAAAVRAVTAAGAGAAAPASDGRRPKFCEECGSPLEGAGKFCAECGTRVVAPV